jgi:fumarylacetoacetase
LRSDENDAAGGIDVVLEVSLQSARMRAEGREPVRLSRTSFHNMYWTLAQMLAHHTSNGCNLEPADLLGSGTVSGPQQDALGSLLEMTRQGAEPLRLPTGETRSFLADGDEVIFRAYCEGKGYAKVGFGECRGVINGL